MQFVGQLAELVPVLLPASPELDIGERTVERKLNLIRRKWEKVAEA